VYFKRVQTNKLDQRSHLNPLPDPQQQGWDGPLDMLKMFYFANMNNGAYL